MNHSVYHKKEPPRKNIIRGTSYYTGYVMEVIGPQATRFTYISQSNPGGKIPAWLVNKLFTVVAPKVIQKMVKACRVYEVWKKNNNPEYMPWLWPDQICTNLIDWNDVSSSANVETTSSCSEEPEDIQVGDITDDIITDT
ncbi:STARD10 [Bugula neritina]|uniref:STARD10 n=1 Tax=Bugula neritina TaxID=10212 RepID=A0A7J7J8D7_BUGNE|nr:STARD10 [Bugula neritina]